MSALDSSEFRCTEELSLMPQIAARILSSHFWFTVFVLSVGPWALLLLSMKDWLLLGVLAIADGFAVARRIGTAVVGVLVLVALCELLLASSRAGEEAGGAGQPIAMTSVMLGILLAVAVGGVDRWAREQHSGPLAALRGPLGDLRVPPVDGRDIRVACRVGRAMQCVACFGGFSIIELMVVPAMQDVRGARIMVVCTAMLYSALVFGASRFPRATGWASTLLGGLVSLACWGLLIVNGLYLAVSAPIDGGASARAMANRICLLVLCHMSLLILGAWTVFLSRRTPDERASRAPVPALRSTLRCETCDEAFPSPYYLHDGKCARCSGRHRDQSSMV